MPDYSDLMAGNPYFAPQPKNNLNTLGAMLTNMGAGIAQSGANGQPWFAGIGQGAAMASNSLARQKEQDDLEEARRFQMGLHLQQLKQLQDDRDLKNKGIAALVAANAPEGVPGGGMQAPPPPLMSAPAAQAISGIESAGQPNNGYGAVGPAANAAGDRAYGKYQIMGANIPAWTKEVLGTEMTPQQFLTNPQAQDTVFNNKFGQYEKKYGPVGAAKAWFAGEGGMNNPNAKDVNGMTVSRYGQQFAANGGAAAAPGGAGPTFASLPPFEGAGMPDPAMQPRALPPGVNPKVNLPSALAAPSASPVLPPFQIPGGPQPSVPTAGLPQPNVVQGDSQAPTPQVIPAQYTPPPAIPAPGPPPQVPRPTQLPADEANVLNNMLMTRAITPEQFIAQKNKRLNEIHSDQQTAATEAWKQQNETYRFERGEATKKDVWQVLPPDEAQKMGLPPNVLFKTNRRTGDVQPVRDTKEADRDITGSYADPDVQKIVGALSPADRAAFNAAAKAGDHKGASAIITKAQTGLTEEQQSLTGQALINTLPFGDKELVGGLVDGSLKPSDLSKRVGNGADINRYIALARRADPGYTPNDAGSRNAFETKYMVTGQGGQTLVNANTAMSHLDTFLKAQNALKNGDMPAVNAFVNAAKKQFGDAAVPSAEVAMQLYAAEAAKAARGAGALNEAEEKQMQKNLSTASSPAQAYGVASTLAELLMGKVHGIEDMARSHDISEDRINKYMSPRSREILEQVKKGPPGAAPNKMRPSLDSIFGNK